VRPGPLPERSGTSGSDYQTGDTSSSRYTSTRSSATARRPTSRSDAAARSSRPGARGKAAAVTKCRTPERERSGRALAAVASGAQAAVWRVFKVAGGTPKRRGLVTSRRFRRAGLKARRPRGRAARRRGPALSRGRDHDVRDGGGRSWTLTDWFENLYLQTAGPPTRNQALAGPRAVPPRAGPLGRERRAMEAGARWRPRGTDTRRDGAWAAMRLVRVGAGRLAVKVLEPVGQRPPGRAAHRERDS